MALPQADWYVLRSDHLEPIDGGEPLTLAADLGAEMNATPRGVTLLAREPGGIWRLRRGGPAAPSTLWQVQALSESRRRVFARLRDGLASRLSSQLLHELRNPMNAMSLHADLLGRLITTADGGERAAASVNLIRDRLKELATRQNALVSLWLGAPADSSEAMLSLFESALRIVRAHGALHELRVRETGSAALRRSRASTVAAHAEVGIVAILLLACDLAIAAGRAPAELVIDLTILPNGAPNLRVPMLVPRNAPLPQSGGMIPAHLGAFVDELALLLDNEPLSVQIGADCLNLIFEPA